MYFKRGSRPRWTAPTSVAVRTSQHAQYGHHFTSHTTHCDLAFPEPLSVTPDELMFHDGYWQIIVSRTLVIQERDSGASSADDSKVSTPPIT
jgi:hypothetical protein